ncbi:uncharacterized protein LOC143984217 [Lithobates pipiens]
MSDVGKSGRPIIWEWTDPRTPSKEEQAILDKVKEEFERRTQLRSSKFRAVLVRTLMLDGGTHYLFLVEIGELPNICLYVSRALCGVQDPEPNLKKILPAEKIYENPLVT